MTVKCVCASQWVRQGAMHLVDGGECSVPHAAFVAAQREHRHQRRQLPHL